MSNVIDFEIGIVLLTISLISGVLLGCIIKLIDVGKLNISNTVNLVVTSIILPYSLVISFIKENSKYSLKTPIKYLAKICITLFIYSITKMSYITDCIVQRLNY